MRTVEECYTYVIARRNKLVAKKCKERAVALGTAVPVCGIAIFLGVVSALQNEKTNISGHIYPADNTIMSNNIDESAVLSSKVSIDNPIESIPKESIPKYENNLNIGEVEIPDRGHNDNMFLPPPFYEMTRNQVLEHFGLSTEFDLSGIVEGLYETEPADNIFNRGGKHGFCRMMNNDEWGEIPSSFENDVFRFEKEGESKWVEVVFSRTVIPWWRSYFFRDESFKTLPKSLVANTEMIVCKRSIGGYYAEFEVDNLTIGLTTVGLSESETVDILEYLAEFTNNSYSFRDNKINFIEVPFDEDSIIN